MDERHYGLEDLHIPAEHPTLPTDPGPVEDQEWDAAAISQIQPPDGIEPLYGYRVFLLKNNVLESLAITGFGWQPGVNTATCASNGLLLKKVRGNKHQPGEIAPARACGCGLYAYNNDTIKYNAAYYSKNAVVAAVKAWGNIEVHNDGFRAEKAEIIALMPGPASEIPVEVMQTTADLYQVPVVNHFPHLEAIAQQQGVVKPTYDQGYSHFAGARLGGRVAIMWVYCFIAYWLFAMLDDTLLHTGWLPWIPLALGIYLILEFFVSQYTPVLKRRRSSSRWRSPTE